MSDVSLQFARADSLRLQLECELSEVRPAARAVLDFLNDLGVSEEEKQACELSLVEACNNAVHYVEEGDRAKAVEVEAVCSPDLLELRVMDHTAGFEWPDTVRLPEPEEESGRGLFLIQSLMDEVNYFRGTCGNYLVMRKRRAGRRGVVTTEQAGLHDVNRKLVESEQVIRDMAEELSFCYESLSAIFRCSADLGRTINLEEFAQRLLTDLSQITSAEWFFLRLVQEGMLVVFTTSDPALQLDPLPLASSEAGPSVELEAAAARQDLWFDEQRPLEQKDPLGAIKPRSIGLIHPIFLADQLIGTLTVGRSNGRAHFTAVHANVVHTFADFLAIQIVNARYQEEQVNSRLVSRELEIARNIQRSLLPKALPYVPGYSLAGFCESARQVGGDFYDVLRINNHGVLLIIADVMGKGIPAAIFAAILRSLLRAVPEWTSEPGALLARVNRLLFEELSGVDMFITAQLVFVDTVEHRLVAASAGHCPTLVAIDSQGQVKTLAPEGLPLGILPDTTFSNQEESLGKEHRILLYTDGLTEARNPQGEFFGQERLMKWFRARLDRPRTAEELKEDLANELKTFQANGLLNDDQTFLIMA